VAILIVFAILLTRSGETPNTAIVAPGWVAGLAVALAVFGVVGWMILNSTALPAETPAAPEATVRQLGDALMTKYVLPLQGIGLLLTAAMIGAVIIALRERGEGK
jgi:NADH-quinone oxidoreductase subunit J